MHDRHGVFADGLRQRIFDGAGSLAPTVRQSLASGVGEPDDLASFGATVRRSAHQVEDSHVAHLATAGYTGDQVYEATISAALGAGMIRLDAGMRALAESLAATPEPAVETVPLPVIPPVTPSAAAPFMPIAVADPAAAPLMRRQPGVNIPGRDR
jgi:hypothetical protein